MVNVPAHGALIVNVPAPNLRILWAGPVWPPLKLMFPTALNCKAWVPVLTMPPLMFKVLLERAPIALSHGWAIVPLSVFVPLTLSMAPWKLIPLFRMFVVFCRLMALPTVTPPANCNAAPILAAAGEMKIVPVPAGEVSVLLLINTAP